MANANFAIEGMQEKRKGKRANVGALVYVYTKERANVE